MHLSEIKINRIVRMEGNFCFLCLEQLEEERSKVKVKRGRKSNDEVLIRRKATSSIKLLLKYLLNCGSYNEEGVLKEVLKLGGLAPEGEVKGSSSCSRNGLFRTCGLCESTAGTVLELHLELEQLQMKMVNEVRSVRERILRGSGWLGGNGDGADQQEEDMVFEHFSKRFLGGSCSPKMKYFYHVLKRFHGSVKKIDKESVHVPLVYLERFGIPCHNASGSGLIDPERNVKVERIPNLGPGADLSDEGDSFQDFFQDAPNDEDLGDGDILKSNENSELKIKDLEPERNAVAVKKEPDEGALSLSSASAIPGSGVAPPPAPEGPVKTETGEEEEDTSSRSRRACATYATFSRNTKEKIKRLKREGNLLQKKLKKVKVAKVKSSGTRKSKLTTPAVGSRSRSAKTPPNEKYIRPRYTCAICPFIARMVGSFEQHLREHETEDKLFYCEACDNLGFSTDQFHTFHKEQHGYFHKLKCDLCQYMVNSLELSAHLKGHDVETVFACSSCSHCSSSAEKYISHLRSVHSFKDGRRVSCQLCGGEFRNRNKLASHFYEVHKAIPKLECDFEGCPKTFLEAEALALHKVSHSGRFDCGKCGRGCTSQADLRFHRQVVHQKERSHQCDHCPRAFASAPLLQDHLMQQHGAEKLKCKICEKEYASSSGLQYHMAVTHEEDGDGKRCPICNMKFDAVFRLKMHIESHSNERNYVCEECGSAFRTVRNYKDHRRRVHTPKREGKHRCSYCDKCYVIRKDLTAHVRTHTGERPYVCDFCGRAFAHSGSFFNHKRSCGLRSSSVAKGSRNSNSSVLTSQLIPHLRPTSSA